MIIRGHQRPQKCVKCPCIKVGVRLKIWWRIFERWRTHGAPTPRMCHCEVLIVNRQYLLVWYDLPLYFTFFLLSNTSFCFTTTINSLWWHRTWKTLVQVRAWCLTAPSCYQNQCWISSKIHLKVISQEVLMNFIRNMCSETTLLKL